MCQLNKEGFLQSDSSKKTRFKGPIEVLYTQDDMCFILDKGPIQHLTNPKITITSPGVIKLLRDLNPFKLAGPDSIPNYILKVAAEEVSPFLTRIFQVSLDSGDVTSDWREIHIAPSSKKGDKHQASNYRPVSLTSVSCKILEHIFHSSILNHLV